MAVIEYQVTVLKCDNCGKVGYVATSSDDYCDILKNIDNSTSWYNYENGHYCEDCLDKVDETYYESMHYECSDS